MGWGNPIVGAGGALVRPAIKSPNYAAGVSGWEIARDGSAEFNDLTVRGIFRGTQFVINANGTFFYDPTPGAGNLVGSWAAAAGTDEYGNAYRAGIVSYLFNEFAQSFNGAVFLGVEENPAAPFGPQPGQLGVLGDNSAVVLVSPTTTALPATAEIDVVAAAAGHTSGQTAYQHTATLADAWITGVQRHARFVSGVLTPEIPQAPPAYTASFAGGSTFGTFVSLEFWIDAQDNLVVAGSFHALAAITSAAVFTLPAGYMPAGNWTVPVASMTSAGAAISSPRLLQVQSNGVVTLKSPVAVTIGDNVYVSATIPLGHLA